MASVPAAPRPDDEYASSRPVRTIELERLAVHASSGDQEALDHLLALLRAPVVTYCRARLGADAGLPAPDAVARDVLIAVCAALPGGRTPESSMIRVVHEIANRIMSDALRKAGRGRSESRGSAPRAAGAGVGTDEVVAGRSCPALPALLEQLAPPLRDVLVLRIALRQTPTETAAALDTTPDDIRVLQHRALVELRAMIAEPQRRSPDCYRSAPGSKICPDHRACWGGTPMNLVDAAPMPADHGNVASRGYAEVTAVLDPAG
jgi:RNA polymerase sigma-70 factor, ECF subfamily